MATEKFNMKTANAELIKGIISGLKLTAAWTFLAPASFGMEAGRAIWRLHNDFYPFNLILYGGATVFTLFAGRAALTRLTYAVPLTDVEATRLKTREYLVYNFGIACFSFGFGLSLAGSKGSGGLYPIAAVALGALLILNGFLMRGAIKRLAAFVTALGSADEIISLPAVNNTNL